MLSLFLLLSAMHHDRRRLLSTSSSLYLLLHIRPVLDVLAEIADVAADFLVGFQREGYDGHEAEGEPFPALGYLWWGLACVDGGGGDLGLREGETYAAGEVTAVLALYGDVLCACEGGVEDWGRLLDELHGRVVLRKSVPCVPHVKKKNMAQVCMRRCCARCFVRWKCGGCRLLCARCRGQWSVADDTVAVGRLWMRRKGVGESGTAVGEMWRGI
jgi:hypothetical protein